MTDTRTKLLENFDEEVHQRLKLSRDASEQQLDRLEKALWAITKLELNGLADFDDGTLEFVLHQTPSEMPETPRGKYQFVRRSAGTAGAHAYRLGHGLAQKLLESAMARHLSPALLEFDYSASNRKIGLLDALIGRSGWLQVTKLTVDSFEQEDQILAAVIADDGEVLHSDVGNALFQVDANQCDEINLDEACNERLSAHTGHLVNQALARNSERNNRFFEEELEKLERWADDLKSGLETELKDFDQKIKQAGKDSKLAATLEAKLDFVKLQKELETSRNRKRRELYDAQDAIDVQKNGLIESVESRLRQLVRTENVLSLRFTVK